MGALEDLVTEFARLPGIGRKTAQRLAFHLLQQPGERLVRLARALVAVAERVRPCAECGNLTEGERCDICCDPRRDAGIICVVEEPSAVTILERAGEFRGRYHVLGGRLSPLGGSRTGGAAARAGCCPGRAGGVREVILATNPSMEGEVTATYVQQLLAGQGRPGDPPGARAADGRRPGVRRWRHPGPCADRAAGGPLMARRGAVLLGMVAGAASRLDGCPERHVGRHRADLFSPRPLRRLAALGDLAAQRSVETVRLLRDYLAWERHPVLRRRAGAIVRRMEATLG